MLQPYVLVRGHGGKGKGQSPCVLRIGIGEGHGSGKTEKKLLDEWMDIFSFIANSTGAVWLKDKESSATNAVSTTNTIGKKKDAPLLH